MTDMNAVLDPLDRWILDQVPAALAKTMATTYKFQKKYEALRLTFVKAGGDMKASKKAYRIAIQMHGVENELDSLWAPYRDIVGACPKCKGTRVPGLMPEGKGFGCQACHDFEVVIRVKSA